MTTQLDAELPQPFDPSASHVNPDYRDGWNAATKRMEAYCAGMARYADELKETAAEVQRLQRALCFWLPCVPAEDSEIAERAGDDAFLLCGYEGPAEPSAEDLGWVSRRLSEEQEHTDFEAWMREWFEDADSGDDPPIRWLPLHHVYTHPQVHSHWKTWLARAAIAESRPAPQPPQGGSERRCVMTPQQRHEDIARRFPGGLTPAQFRMLTLESADDDGKLDPPSIADWFAAQSLLMGMFIEGLIEKRGTGRMHSRGGPWFIVPPHGGSGREVA